MTINRIPAAASDLGADWEGRPDHLPYGLLAAPDAERLPHIPLGQLPHIVAKLHPEWAIQPVELPQPGKHLFVQGVVLAELYLQGVAWGVEPERERYEQDYKQDREEEYDPPERINQHSALVSNLESLAVKSTPAPVPTAGV